MTRSGRWKRVLRRGLAILVLALLGVVAINAFDAELSPVASRVLALRAAEPDVAPELNAYLLVLGLKAPADAEPAAWAQEYVQRLHDVELLREARREDPSLYEDAFEAEEALKLFEQSRLFKTRWCEPEVKPCLRDIAKRVPKLTQQRAAMEAIRDRTRTITRAAVFEETYLPTDFEAPWPSTQGLSDAQQAAFLQAWLLAEGGRLGDAVEVLREDFQLHRTVYAQVKTLLPKVMSHLTLNRSMLFAAELLTQPRFSKEQVERYMEVLRPAFSQDELSLQPAIDRELLMGMHLLRKDFPGRPAPRPDQAWLAGAWNAALAHFYHPNRTMNCTVANYTPISAINGAILAKRPAARATYERERPALEKLRWYEYLINPFGHVLCRMGAPDYGNYVLAQSDLEVLRRAVALILRASQGPEDVHALSRHAAFLNPYSGQPFDIDPGQRTLRFQPLATSGIMKKLTVQGKGAVVLTYR